MPNFDGNHTVSHGESANEESGLQPTPVASERGRSDAIIRAVPEFIYSNNLQGKITWASLGFCKFLNRSERSILNEDVREFFPRDYQRLNALDKEIFKKPVKQIAEMDITIRLPSRMEGKNLFPVAGQFLEASIKTEQDYFDEIRAVVISKTPIFQDGTGNCVEILTTVNDVTKQKQADLEMFRVFTHDFLNVLYWIRDKHIPLIKEYCERSEKASREKQVEALETCEDLQKICDLLLAIGMAYGFLSIGHTVARWDMNHDFQISEPFDLVLDILKPQNTHIDFSLHSPKLKRVTSDKQKILAIALLLLRNSIDAIEKVKNPSVQHSIQIVINVVGSRLNIDISDSGIGLAEEDYTEQEKFFKLGFSRSGSSGFGLYIIKLFIDSCNGIVRFERKKEKSESGTCCHIEVEVE
ncbi:MAG TPA: ATP-binding protein [Verrucomicrobiae bacterium]|nr:ATP-binding protein [Verrucomicrobiae bacterium]